MEPEIREIKHIRKKLELTQSQLASRANVSQSLIAKIESGRLDPTYSNARKIFAALNEITKKKDIKAEEIMTKKIISVDIKGDIKKAIGTMKKANISQMPVMDGKNPVGYVSESIILDAISRNKKSIKDIMEDHPPIISKDATEKVISNLLKFYPMMLVSEKGRLIGIITKFDLLSKLYK